MTNVLTRAVVCRDLTGPDDLRLEEVELVAPRAGEVRVAVRASGLNFPDLLMSEGKYQLKPELPFTLGFEAAGVIDATGPGVSGHAVGDRVMVRQWWGCHAQALVAPTDALLPLPDGFSFEEGAAFVVATSTAVNGVMQRGQLRAGETLLVHGAAGGVGLAAVEVGKLLGATVIATASSPTKLAVARARGADHGIDTTAEDFRARVMEITGGRGADVVFDPVGGDVFEASLRCMAWGGRILVVGFASGRIPEDPDEPTIAEMHQHHRRARHRASGAQPDRGSSLSALDAGAGGRGAFAAAHLAPLSAGGFPRGAGRAAIACRDRARGADHGLIRLQRQTGKRP